ncbi:exosome non-catalytic core subunit rrp46 [Coemansia interrupta]|uniref:Exosome non-catalytic core subunit rrp46 n=1 Tax=Coemansia interrupta TaxID=1126814 RepID=A0A9W8LNS7_9FUNG|nr:exosome non-catalytic core subunit rrp46 [Coemansia interrupta]
MARPDRRDTDQLRALTSVLGQLSRADGSAHFASGDTSVVCGVYGPVEAKLFDERLDRAHVEVKLRPDVGTPGTKDKWLEAAVRQTFERHILGHLHPRTLVQVSVQVRQDAGSLDACAINAAMLALVDAGVPLATMVAAATCAVLEDGRVVADPVAEEVEGARSVHTFAFAEGRPAEPVYVDSRGTFDMPEYDACYGVCAAAVGRVLAFMRSAIESKVTRESQVAGA